MPRDIDALGGRGGGHDERLKSRKTAEAGDPMEGMSDVSLLLDTCCRVRVLRIPIFAGRALLLRQARRLGMFVLTLYLRLLPLVLLRDLQIRVERAGGRAALRAEHLESLGRPTATVTRLGEQTRHPG